MADRQNDQNKGIGGSRNDGPNRGASPSDQSAPRNDPSRDQSSQRGGAGSAQPGRNQPDKGNAANPANPANKPGNSNR